MISKKWITIVFQNKEVCHYRPNEYTDYQYDGKYFVVIKDGQWIGLYNLDVIQYVEVASQAEINNYTFYTRRDNADDTGSCD